MGNQLNCLEQCRTHQEQHQRLLILQQGGVFKRKKFLLGIQAGSEKIHLRLSGDEQFFVWKPQEGNTTPTKIDVNIIGSIKVQGSTNLTLLSRKGEVLLDLDAEDEELRNVWVTNMQLLCEDGDEGTEQIEEAAQTGSRFRRMVEDRAKKQAYWAQRTQELEDRKKEAEERKKQFAGAGMKYTALAMSNRVPSAKSDD